jgi:hypothetical protein
MANPRSTAAHASVVFLKIPEFSQHPVSEQVRLKDRLEGKVAAALTGLQVEQRIVLEAPDGAAVVVLGDPAAALRFARRSSAGGDGIPVAAGISHGPVRVAEGGVSPIVLGDGLAVADAVAGLAPQGHIAATREFRDALARAAPAQAWHLAPAGMQSDARERSHELFLADEKTAARRRRRMFVALAAAFAGIVALGVVARMGIEDARKPAPLATAAAPTRPAKPAAPPAPPALATLRLEIRPQGEVLIDGVAKGKSPPLVSLQVPPGRHRIEVRRPGASALVLQVDAGPGEELAIKHSFPAPPPKSAWRKFFDQFK